MSTNGKMVSHEIFSSNNVGSAAIQVCQFLDENKASLISVSQIRSEDGTGIFTTVFYTPE